MQSPPLPGYTYDELFVKLDRYHVYRGFTVSDGQAVFIKVPAIASPSADDYQGLLTEFEISRNLEHKGIIKPLHVEHHGDAIALILEDSGGIPLRDCMNGASLPLDPFFSLAVPLTELLALLHENGVGHYAIQPDHLVVDPVNYQPKLHGFAHSAFAVLSDRSSGSSLAYLSPEQTGRMNRTVDYRADLYALGMTFYELLSGHLPFQATGPLEWIHAHMARTPAPLHELAPNLPNTVCGIIMKLLSKMPEERYQSAESLLADLEVCRKQWDDEREIQDFPLDQPDRTFLCRTVHPLFGRERELAALSEVYDRILQGTKGVVFISGQAGTGKTALIRAFVESLADTQTAVLWGKFDQQKRGIPYEPILNAFRDAIRKFRRENGNADPGWKQRLADALGERGVRLLAEVIPELRDVVEPAEKPSSLSPEEKHQLFLVAFRRFVRLIGRKDRPIVLFMDDLQWADPATGELLESLMTDPESAYLLFIGAYRDHELEETEGPVPIWEKVTGSESGARTLRMLPFSVSQLKRYLGDLLSCNSPEMGPLAGVLFHKTAGNPFYLTLILKFLSKQRLLKYDFPERQWKCELAAIESLEENEDLLSYLTATIGALPAPTREAIGLAACFGGGFDLRAVASMAGLSILDAVSHLMPAVKEGLILSLAETEFDPSLPEEMVDRHRAVPQPANRTVHYRFIHDRVQQSAYARLDGARRTEAHAAAGRFLMEHSEPDERMERIFEIAHHLNLSIKEQLPAIRTERGRLIEINVFAGGKAKTSTAYKAALTYYETAIGLTTEEEWKETFEFCFGYHLSYAEVLHLNETTADMEPFLDGLLQRARNRSQRAKVSLIRLTHYVKKGAYADAIRTGLDALQEYGIDIPRQPGQGALKKERAAIRELALHHLNELAALPEVTDPDLRMVMDLMIGVIFPAFFTEKGIYTFLTSKVFESTFRNGYISTAEQAFSIYGMHASQELEEYGMGQQLLETAYELSEIHGSPSSQCMANFLLGKFLGHWTDQGERSEAHLKKAVQLAAISADSIIAALPMSEHVHFTYAHGTLEQLETLVEAYLHDMEQSGNSFRIDYLHQYRRWILTHQEISDELIQLGVEQLDEQVEQQSEAKAYRWFRYYTFKAQLHYLSGNFREVIRVSEAAAPLLHYTKVMIYQYEYYFFEALGIAAAWGTLSDDERARIGKLVRRNGRYMAKWAAVNPHYFLHKQQAIAAEIARMEGKEAKAEDLYLQSVRSARDAGYILNEAIVCERLADLYEVKGREKVAEIYLREAHEGYRQWGAVRKTRQMEAAYPWLQDDKTPSPKLEVPSPLAHQPLPVALARQGIYSDDLDAAAAVKAAQSFSGGSNPDKVLLQLLGIAVQSAGAQRGLLIVEHGSQLFAVASVDLDLSDARLLVSTPMEHYPAASQSIVRIAARTLLPFRTDNAHIDSRLSDDIYLMQRKPKSVLCLPIINEGRPKVLLYLENDHVTHAFAPERDELLRTLASQAYYAKHLMDLAVTQASTASLGHEGTGELLPLTDPITVRELEVLNLIAAGLSNQEIAKQLGVVLGTVKNHVNNIFSKLQVNKRMKAVSLAKQLRLLDDVLAANERTQKLHS